MTGNNDEKCSLNRMLKMKIVLFLLWSSHNLDIDDSMDNDESDEENALYDTECKGEELKMFIVKETRMKMAPVMEEGDEASCRIKQLREKNRPTCCASNLKMMISRSR